jgi:AcrR family transcriptional regulator
MSTPVASSPASPPIGGQSLTDTSDRFRAKRERIVDAAARVINENGLRGLTFVSVADAVDMNTTSITYYFKRKELLAAAALERSILHLTAMAEQANAARSPEERVKSFVRLFLEQCAEETLETRRPLARLSDMRAMDDPLRSELSALYTTLYRRIMGVFRSNTGVGDAALNWARANTLLDTLHWSRAWLPDYSLGDYERVGARLSELYTLGLAPEGAVWAPQTLAVPDSDQNNSGEVNFETYLRAATQTINERGYRGASVERIAAALNVSKGSFYHHLSGKDDLVLDCFSRSYGRVSQTQRAAMALPGTWWDRITAASAALAEVQFEARFPLLRVTALNSLPPELRASVIHRSNRMAHRFAGMMIDGITEGSVRTIDPIIASQCLMASINSAFDFRIWAQHRDDRATAIQLYFKPLAYGLYAD